MSKSIKFVEQKMLFLLILWQVEKNLKYFFNYSIVLEIICNIAPPFTRKNTDKKESWILLEKFRANLLR